MNAPKKIQRIIHELDDQYMNGDISRKDLAKQIVEAIVGQSEKAYQASLRYVVRVMCRTFHAFSDVEVTIHQYGLDDEMATGLRGIIKERSTPHGLRDLLWGDIAVEDRPLSCHLSIEQAGEFEKDFHRQIKSIDALSKDFSNLDQASDVVKHFIEERQALIDEGKKIISSAEPHFKNLAHLLVFNTVVVFEAHIFNLLGMDRNQFENRISANKLTYLDFKDNGIFALFVGQFEPKNENGERSFPASGYDLFDALVMKVQDPNIINMDAKWEIANAVLSGRDRKRYPQSYGPVEEIGMPPPSRAPKFK